MIGKTLRQRYKIIKKLSEGGFGEIYVAKDIDIPVEPKPKCAVKRIEITDYDSYIIKLFEKEAQTLYKLSEHCTQIPKLLAFFWDDPDFYLVQELIEGKDLSREFTSSKKWSEEKVIKLVREILEILVCVHKHKIIHGDIKPQNIIRRKDDRLVLIDFGAVREINNLQLKIPGLKAFPRPVGTLGYMPQEQEKCQPKLSSDIYALGVMAIQALTGVPPWKFVKDDFGEIIWINLVNISDSLAEILTKMVRSDFKKRYANAAEALQAFNEKIKILPPLEVTDKWRLINKKK